MSLKWLPNALTLTRILAGPVVGYLVWQASTATSPEQMAKAAFLAAIIFTVASMTDWLDGFVARALNATSEFGAKLDLWADKIIVASAVLGLLPKFPLIAVGSLIALTGRDLYVMRLRAQNPDANLTASAAAKFKTAIVMFGIAVSLLGLSMVARDWVSADTASNLSIAVLTTGGVLFVFGCALSLYTAWQYTQAARRST